MKTLAIAALLALCAVSAFARQASLDAAIQRATGELESIAGFFRLRARVIEVETAAIRGSYVAGAQNDAAIAYLRGAAGGTARRAPDRGSPGMVRVDGGTFQMGRCPSGVGLWCGSPTRSVTVDGFWMSRFPVTQGEWFDVMGANPSHFQGANVAAGANWRSLPVENVSWFDAAEFANAKSRRAGLAPAYAISGTGDNRVATWNRNANGYRLPTEAEWEFAARGGAVCRGNFEFSGGDALGEVGWYQGNSMDRTREVGLLRPNALGLYDMSGNVWEWVWDWWGAYPSAAQTNPVGASSGSDRVMRGGSWDSAATNARSANRGWNYPSVRWDGVGFRLVRSP